MNYKKFHKGFTLLEIVIVLAIAAIILSIVFFSFTNLNSKKMLEKNRDMVVSVLNEARSTTLSSLNASQYGVKVDPTQVTLFKGSSYSVGAPDNVLNTLDSSVGIRNISLAGGATQVVFDRLTGRTGESGTFELYLINDPTSSSTISVSGSGIIEAN